MTRDELLERLVVRELDPRTFVRCLQCEDTGWVLHRCPGDASCGRHTSGYVDGAYFAKCLAPHTFVTRCSHRRPA